MGKIKFLLFILLGLIIGNTAFAYVTDEYGNPCYTASGFGTSGVNGLYEPWGSTTNGTNVAGFASSTTATIWSNGVYNVGSWDGLGENMSIVAQAYPDFGWDGQYYNIAPVWTDVGLPNSASITSWGDQSGANLGSSPYGSFAQSDCPAPTPTPTPESTSTLETATSTLEQTQTNLYYGFVLFLISAAGIIWIIKLH